MNRHAHVTTHGTDCGCGSWTGKALRIAGLILLTGLLLSSVAPPAEAQRLSGDYRKAGSRFLEAFRGVVAEPNQSTVRVLCDGEQQSLGTVVGAEGWILTKASELSGRITCVLSDDRELAADLVGVDSTYDLALLRVEAEDLPVIAWREGDEPGVGAWVVTPGQHDLPCSVGVLSVGRRAIAPQRGVLGISLADDDRGARVTHVFPESAAERAGLRRGDIIVSVGEETVSNSSMLITTVGRHRPGDTLELDLLRGDSSIEATVTLADAFPGDFDRNTFQNRLGGNLSLRRGGFPAVLQHDSVLDPQDCGGPLVTLDGRAVGLNIARAGRTATFAIPAGEIPPLVEKLKSGKYAPLEGVTEVKRSVEPAPAE